MLRAQQNYEAYDATGDVALLKQADAQRHEALTIPPHKPRPAPRASRSLAGGLRGGGAKTPGSGG
jgi:hypothetical protein